jgi:hypothetical protein
VKLVVSSVRVDEDVRVNGDHAPPRPSYAASRIRSQLASRNSA